MPSDVAKRILEVPVIDIGALMTCQDDATVGQVLREDNPALREVIVNVRAAAAEWGFFYIKNHGVSEVQMQRFQNAMRAFFALPNDAKNLLRRSKTNQRGYSDHEFTKQLLDNKEVFDVGGPAIDGPPGDGVERLAQEQNQWPADNVLPGFRATMTEYFSDMTHIARRLIQIVRTNDGAAPIHDHTSQFRLNRYPPSPEPEKTMGVYHHTDSGAVTVLLQDDEVKTLQVFHRESQTWVNVPPVKDTYVINIGDMVQVWSNDKFVAPLHRVKACDRERFSAPFFYLPSYRAVVEPIVVREDEKPHYRGISWREFREKRFLGNEADVGEEIQIHHYRVD